MLHLLSLLFGLFELDHFLQSCGLDQVFLNIFIALLLHHELSGALPEFFASSCLLNWDHDDLLLLLLFAFLRQLRDSILGRVQLFEAAVPLLWLWTIASFVH